MSKLKILIEELCPNGVKNKKLGEVCDFVNGFAFRSSLFREDGEKIIRITNINGRTVDIDDVKYFYKEDYKTDLEQYSIKNGDILIAMSGATTGKIGCYNYDDISYLNQRVGKFKPHNGILSRRYLYHVLLANTGTLNVLAGGGAQPNLSSTKLMETFEFPVPPFVVQEEIANILDRFAEYAAELQARQEQYEYYRNKLLTFSEMGGGIQGVIWMKMSEIGTFIRGKRFVRTDIVNDGVPCIHYGDMYTYYGLYATESKGMLKNELAPKMRYAQKNDVVIVAAGENKEDIGIGMAWLGDEPAAVHDACFIFKSDLYPQYVSHYLRTNYYHKQIVKHVSDGKICSISAKGLGSAIIPIPSYEEQVRIATLLNKFDELVSDLVQGLPAEIAAVKEQYEYYRNKLLSFPEYKLSA